MFVFHLFSSDRLGILIEIHFTKESCSKSLPAGVIDYNQLHYTQKLQFILPVSFLNREFPWALWFREDVLFVFSDMCDIDLGSYRRSVFDGVTRAFRFPCTWDSDVATRRRGARASLRLWTWGRLSPSRELASEIPAAEAEQKLQQKLYAVVRCVAPLYRWLLRQRVQPRMSACIIQ